MPPGFRNQYRADSNRATNWDYSSDAAYFITICTKFRKCYFGHIVFDHTLLHKSSCDPVVESKCISTLQQDHQSLQRLNDVIGPSVNLSDIGKIAEEEWLKAPLCRPDMNIRLGVFVVMPNHIHGILIIGSNSFNTPYVMGDVNCKFGPQRKNLPSIIRGYKSSVTTHARKLGIEFEWQSSFYDHILSDEADFNRITEYINNNPREWYQDRLYMR